MACFLAPTAAAIITTITKKKVSPRLHFEWLNAMLWGAAIASAVEHVVRGELVFYPPFLTNGFVGVWPEILKVGIPMTLIVFALWAVIVFVAAQISKIKEIKVKKV